MNLKKLFCLLLCMVMLLSLSPLALAEGTGETTPPTEDSTTGDNDTTTGDNTPTGGDTTPVPTNTEEHTHDSTVSASYGNLTDATHEATYTCNTCPADYVPTAVTEPHVYGENDECACGQTKPDPNAHVHNTDGEKVRYPKDGGDAVCHNLTIYCLDCPDTFVSAPVDEEHNFGTTGTETCACGEPAPHEHDFTNGDCACGQPAPHEHGMDMRASTVYKDEQTHTVTTQCSACPEGYVDSKDEPHSFVNGICLCTYTQAASVTLTDGTVTYYNTLTEAFAYVDDCVIDETINEATGYKTPGAVIKLLRDIKEDNLSLTGSVDDTALEAKLDLNGKEVAPKTESIPMALTLNNVKLGITAGVFKGLVKLTDSGFVVEDELGEGRFIVSSEQTLPLVIASGSMAKAENFTSAMVNSFVQKNEDGTVSILPCAHENQSAPGCTVCGAPIEAPHVHAWTYSVAETTPHVLSASCADCPDYTDPITITINAPENLVYNAADKAAALSYSVTEVPEELETTLTYSSAPKNAGDYTASITLGEGENARTATLGFTITPAPISNVTVRVADAQRVYKASAYTPTVTVVGIGGETIDASAYTLSYENNINAGTAKVKAAMGSAANYEGTAEASFTIDKAPLTVTAKDMEAKTNTEGKLPSFTATISGLKSGDILSGFLRYSCAADMSTVGVFEVAPSNAVFKRKTGQLDADGKEVMEDTTANYDIEYVSGLLYVKSVDTIKYKVTLDTFSTVPSGLTDTNYNTAAKIKSALQAKVVGSGYTAANTALYEATAYMSLDGTNWLELNESNFPMGGITVYLPCPKNTAYNTHNYKVSHMFAEDSDRLGYDAGDIEVPTAKDSASGIQVKLNGCSPILIAWIKTNVETGDNANIPLWASLMFFSLTAHVALRCFIRRRYN